MLKMAVLGMLVGVVVVVVGGAALWVAASVYFWMTTPLTQDEPDV